MLNVFQNSGNAIMSKYYALFTIYYTINGVQIQYVK